MQGSSSATALILLSYRVFHRDTLLIFDIRPPGRQMKMSNIGSARAASSSLALALLLLLPCSSRAPPHTLRPRARSSPRALAARRSRAPSSLARPASPAPSPLPFSLAPHCSSLALEPAFQALTRRRALRNVGRCDRPVRSRLPIPGRRPLRWAARWANHAAACGCAPPGQMGSAIVGQIGSAFLAADF